MLKKLSALVFSKNDQISQPSTEPSHEERRNAALMAIPENEREELLEDANHAVSYELRNDTSWWRMANAALKNPYRGYIFDLSSRFEGWEDIKRASEETLLDKYRMASQEFFPLPEEEQLTAIIERLSQRWKYFKDYQQIEREQIQNTNNQLA